MFFFFWKARGGRSSSYQILASISFIIAYSIMDSSVDTVVGFNRVFYFTKVGEMTHVLAIRTYVYKRI